MDKNGTALLFVVITCLLFSVFWRARQSSIICKCGVQIRDRCLTLGLNFLCKSANFDFETAAINAYRTVFPSVSVYACRLHLGQANLWLHIHCLGLTDEYKSSCSEIGRWLHLFHGLAFLHPDDVADAFAFDIMDCAPTSDKTDKFAGYCCSTYVETTTFPNSLWAQISSDVHRTNNGP